MFAGTAFKFFIFWGGGKKYGYFGAYKILCSHINIIQKIFFAIKNTSKEISIIHVIYLLGFSNVDHNNALNWLFKVTTTQSTKSHSTIQCCTNHLHKQQNITILYKLRFSYTVLYKKEII